MKRSTSGGEGVRAVISKAMIRQLYSSLMLGKYAEKQNVHMSSTWRMGRCASSAEELLSRRPLEQFIVGLLLCLWKSFNQQAYRVRQQQGIAIACLTRWVRRVVFRPIARHDEWRGRSEKTPRP